MALNSQNRSPLHRRPDGPRYWSYHLLSVVMVFAVLALPWLRAMADSPLPTPIPNERFRPLMDLYEGGAYREALIQVLDVLGRTPAGSNEWLWLQCIRGAVHYRQGKYAKAQAAFDVVFDHEPDYEIPFSPADGDILDFFLQVRKHHSEKQQQLPPPPPRTPAISPGPEPAPYPEPLAPSQLPPQDDAASVQIAADLRYERQIPDGLTHGIGFNLELALSFWFSQDSRLRLAGAVQGAFEPLPIADYDTTINAAFRAGFEFPVEGLGIVMPYGTVGPSWSNLAGRQYNGMRFGGGLAVRKGPVRVALELVDETNDFNFERVLFSVGVGLQIFDSSNRR